METNTSIIQHNNTIPTLAFDTDLKEIHFYLQNARNLLPTVNQGALIVLKPWLTGEWEGDRYSRHPDKYSGTPLECLRLLSSDLLII